ncbi:MAG: NAD(P)-dependent oxidoreductase [Candidatus Sericytochromatia bacterium]|nr:NAD(P)-dependent oxidoreductase [Candidatus Sericytochromatia bacterium]
MTQPLSLVTGASGFIGSHMLEVLKEAGHRIRATDIPSALTAAPAPGRYPDLVTQLADEVVPADLCQDDLTELVKGVDYIFHIAAIFSYSAPSDVLERVNVGGTERLLAAIQAHNPGLKRIVLWGAGGAYGEPQADKLPIHEDHHPKVPQTAYLQSKWKQEQLVARFAKEHDISFAVVRPFTVYGPRGLYGGGQLLMQTATMGSPMVPRNFTFRIPFVHARDVARGALHVALHPEADGQAFNLADDVPYTTVDFFNLMATMHGRTLRQLPSVPLGLVKGAMRTAATIIQPLAKAFGKVSPVEKDMATLFGWDYFVSNGKLRALGFAFQYPDAARGIRETLHWFREAGWMSPKTTPPLAEADLQTVRA